MGKLKGKVAVVREREGHRRGIAKALAARERGGMNCTRAWRRDKV